MRPLRPSDYTLPPTSKARRANIHTHIYIHYSISYQTGWFTLRRSLNIYIVYLDLTGRRDVVIYRTATRCGETRYNNVYELRIPKRIFRKRLYVVRLYICILPWGRGQCVILIVVIFVNKNYDRHIHKTSLDNGMFFVMYTQLIHFGNTR